MCRPGGDEAAKAEGQHAEHAGQDGPNLLSEPGRVSLEPGRQRDRAQQHEQPESAQDAGDDRAPADQVAARNICAAGSWLLFNLHYNCGNNHH